MGKLSTDDTKHVAELAKLQLTSSEIERFTKQLSSVLGYIEELEEVDVEDVKPTAQVTGLENILRSDEIKVENCLTQDEATSGTDATQNGYFKVKGILSKAL